MIEFLASLDASDWLALLAACSVATAVVTRRG